MLNDTPGTRLREARKRAHMTVDQLSERSGYSSSGVRAIENGQNKLRWEAAEAFAPILGVNPAWLLTGQGEGEGEGFPMVRIIGIVGADAGGEVIQTTGQAGYDMAPLPPGGSAQAVALEVRGRSMRAIADDGTLIYFEDQVNPPTRDMLGGYCIVETEDGRVLFKRLMRGSAPGLYDLESQNAPLLEDVRLKWAAEPTAIIPTKQAIRVIRRVGGA